MKLNILFHDNCFDGMASAGLFRAFFLAHHDAGAEVTYGGLAHGPDGGLTPERLTGDVNAVVDFRYSRDGRLTWWFDHHRSAFPEEADRAHFEADTSGRRFYDPTAPSCAGFLARSLAAHHGFDAGRYDELIRWADVIDAARFPDPTTAVELASPALRLMLWIEHSRSFEERVEVLESMVTRSLAETVARPVVAEKVGPLLERHRELLEAFRARHRFEGGVVYADLTDLSITSVNKFIPYYLHPDARYAVVVLRTPTRAKVSVGYSPWKPAGDREHDISALCERYGGGGHPVVGAVSLTPDQVDDAVRIGKEIRDVLER